MEADQYDLLAWNSIYSPWLKIARLDLTYVFVCLCLVNVLWSDTFSCCSHSCDWLICHFNWPMLMMSSFPYQLLRLLEWAIKFNAFFHKQVTPFSHYVYSQCSLNCWLKSFEILKLILYMDEANCREPNALYYFQIHMNYISWFWGFFSTYGVLFRFKCFDSHQLVWYVLAKQGLNYEYVLRLSNFIDVSLTGELKRGHWTLIAICT